MCPHDWGKKNSWKKRNKVLKIDMVIIYSPNLTRKGLMLKLIEIFLTL